jgi:virginiamycin B lyase
MRWRAGALALALAATACSSASDQVVSGQPSPSTTLAVPSTSLVDGPAVTTSPALPPPPPAEARVTTYAVPAGSRPHDVAPAPDGSVWYTAQAIGELGRLDPATGNVRSVKLGTGSAPHGVIVGPDGAAWVTDGGLNAIVRVDAATHEVTRFALPAGTRNVNMNTAAFGRDGILWFTGQSGFYGRVDPQSGKVDVFTAPRGAGPYGITATPAGEVFYASLAGNHVARVDSRTGEATPIDPPTARQGARRVWSDSTGKIWVSEWTAGQVGVLDPASGTWREWKLPGSRPQAYAVYVDEKDRVWLSDFGANALVMFDPRTEAFRSFPSDAPNASVRQILGRPGEVWGAESGADRLVVVRGA